MSGQSLRLYYMDNMRAVLMILGIPYHAGLLFLPNKSWSISLDQSNNFITAISGFIHLFRMPAFFIIAGYFAALTISRRDEFSWIKSRIFRLGIPLLAGMLILNPIQAAAIYLFNDGEIVNIIGNVIDMIKQSPSLLIRHLWFLPVLIYLCLTLAVVKVYKIVPIRTDDGFEIKDAAIIIYIIAATVASIFPAVLNKLTDLKLSFGGGILSFPLIIKYSVFFYFGVHFYLANGKVQLNKVSIALCTALTLLISIAYVYVWQSTTNFGKALTLILEGFGGILFSILIIKISQSILNVKVDLCEKVVALSFPVYLFHQPVISLAAAATKNLNFSSGTMYVIILSITVIASFGLAHIANLFAIGKILFSGAPLSVFNNKISNEPKLKMSGANEK